MHVPVAGSLAQPTQDAPQVLPCPPYYDNAYSATAADQSETHNSCSTLSASVLGYGIGHCRYASS
jgi:hypothetical protein